MVQMGASVVSSLREKGFDVVPTISTIPTIITTSVATTYRNGSVATVPVTRVTSIPNPYLTKSTPVATVTIDSNDELS